MTEENPHRHALEEMVLDLPVQLMLEQFKLDVYKSNSAYNQSQIDYQRGVVDQTIKLCNFAKALYEYAIANEKTQIMDSSEVIE